MSWDVLTLEERELRDLVRTVARERVAPRAAEIDASHAFPWDVVAAFREAGLFGLFFSSEHGGTGTGPPADGSHTYQYVNGRQPRSVSPRLVSSDGATHPVREDQFGVGQQIGGPELAVAVGVMLWLFLAKAVLAWPWYVPLGSALTVLTGLALSAVWPVRKAV